MNNYKYQQTSKYLSNSDRGLIRSVYVYSYGNFSVRVLPHIMTKALPSKAFVILEVHFFAPQQKLLKSLPSKGFKRFENKRWWFGWWFLGFLL